MQFTFSKQTHEIVIGFQKTKEAPKVGTFVSLPDGNFRRNPVTLNFVPENPVEIPNAAVEAWLLDMVAKDMRSFVAVGEEYPGVNLSALLEAYTQDNKGQRKYSKDFLVSTAAGFATWIADKVSNPAIVPIMQKVVEGNFKESAIREYIKLIDKFMQAFAAYVLSKGESADSLLIEMADEAASRIEEVKKPKEIVDFDLSGV